MNTSIELNEIRELSIEKASRLGAPVNPNLPILDPDLNVRPLEEILNRALVLTCMCACAYGYDKNEALSWLRSENLYESLEPRELKFLLNQNSLGNEFQAQVEGLWSLVWVLSITPELDFSDYCSNKLVEMVPDIIQNENSIKFKKQAKLRTTRDIIKACDLAYLLHWGIVDSRLNRTPIRFTPSPHIVIERRRALEWVLSSDSWEEISLDT